MFHRFTISNILIILKYYLVIVKFIKVKFRFINECRQKRVVPPLFWQLMLVRLRLCSLFQVKRRLIYKDLFKLLIGLFLVRQVGLKNLSAFLLGDLSVLGIVFLDFKLYFLKNKFSFSLMQLINSLYYFLVMNAQRMINIRIYMCIMLNLNVLVLNGCMF